MVNKDRREVPTLRYLRHVKEIRVVENDSLLPLCIEVNGQILGLIDPWDEYERPSPTNRPYLFQCIHTLKPSVIFKYQFRRGVPYFPGTISAGYPCFKPLARPADLLARPRPIDVTARMSLNEDRRRVVVEQANQLAREGYTVHVGRVDIDRYLADLWHSQVGFDWRGSGKLTYRLMEYIRAGVVPILHPLGSEWPVREDVILEDGVHCIFCPDPNAMAEEARRLLADPARIATIRRNLVALWETKLCPEAQGYWTWGKLKAALARRVSGSAFRVPG